MENIKHKQLSSEQALIAKYIFKGYTIAQIASKLNCATSTVSYKMQALFEKYNSKNKLDFMLNIFSHMNNSNKQILDKKNHEIARLEVKYEDLKDILCGLVKNRKNEEHYTYWLNQAKKHI